MLQVKSSHTFQIGCEGKLINSKRARYQKCSSQWETSGDISISKILKKRLFAPSVT